MTVPLRSCEKIDAAYMAVLSRKPTAREKALCLQAQTKGLSTVEVLIYALINLRLALADILRETRKLCEKLDDTLLLVGSEIWMADLSFYQTVRQAARRDVPGADTIYDELKQRSPACRVIPKRKSRHRRPKRHSAPLWGVVFLKNDRF